MKERLTGAIILVALMVLLVPELLTGPVRPAVAPAASASSSEEPPLRSYTIDLADDSRSHTAAATPSAQSNGGAATDSAAASPPSISESATQTATDDATQPMADKPPVAQPPVAQNSDKPVTPGQLGVTEQRAAGQHPGEQHSTAQHTAQPNLPQQHPAEPRTAESKSGELRSTPDKAEAARPEPATGWVVQLGVFASRQNADRLAQTLKSKGFKVAVSENSGGGRKLFRVRAGPVADRSAAQELADKLRSAGAAGTIVPRT